MHSNFYSLGSINMSDVKELFTQGKFVSLLGMKYKYLNLSLGECNQRFFVNRGLHVHPLLYEVLVKWVRLGSVR